ncbi:MAG TPA: chaperone NapD, partial [Arenibaculum sp.]|nr:chaperone NapD [Arenibaculum sp.]
MPAELHIASLLVHVRPERVDAVRERIAALPGAEVHAEQSGRMIVTLEGPHEGWV